MKEDLPITPRPADAFTAQDGIRLFTMLDGNLKRISSSFESFSNMLAIIQKQNIEALNLIKLIEAESAESRVGRLELEIEEAKREKDIAERNLAAVEEKILQKQNIKEKNVDTGEKLKAIAADVVSDVERKKRESEEAFWIDLKRSIVKAVLVSLSVGGVTATLGFIWFLVQLYLNRGTP